MEEGQARFACKFWVAQELEPALMNESSKEADLDLSRGGITILRVKPCETQEGCREGQILTTGDVHV